ncbi:MAG TPA: hypothetical protein VFY16_10255 [Gemmatimonadaceae bacterium]|nr:hypothetical protein [Gemmatimonadaceae bacterium]
MLIVLAAAVLLQLPEAAPNQGAIQAPGTGLRMGITVAPDTVTVGTPFVVSVRLRAPVGARVEFPAGPDTTGPVQALDPLQVLDGDDSLGVDRTARYRLAAWDVGRFPIPIGDVVVTENGRQRRVAVEERFIVVSTVLPADSALRVPKPARAIYEFAGPWWLKWLLALVALGIVGLLVWWWRRRHRGSGAADLDPYEAADARFARVEALGLVEAGERGRYVALMVDVLREYLDAVIPEASVSQTSRELSAALRGHAAVPLDRLAPLLAEADLVKFARRQVITPHALELGREARALARSVHEALARPTVEKAA